MRGKLVLSLFIIALFSVSLATAFEINLNMDSNDIYKTDFAEIYLTVDNEQSFDDQYWIMPIDNIEDFASVRSEPAQHYATQYGLIVPAHSKITTKLIVKPRLGTMIGKQDLGISLKSKKTGEIVSKAIFINILPTPIPIPIYETDVDFEIDMLDRIDPSKVIEIKLNIKNKNLKVFEDVEVKVKTKFFTKESIVKIDEADNKVIKFTAEIDPQTVPQDETVIVDLYYKGDLWKTLTKDFEIIESESSFEKTMEEKTFFLKTTRTIQLSNNGNALKTETLIMESDGWFEELLTSSTPKYEMNQNYYTWEISLDKDEEKTVIIKTSYRPVFWIIIIVIILAIIYLYYRDPLTIKKEATEVDRDGDEISRIKIKVHIKNRCNKTLHDVKIVEKIPQIVKVSRDHQPGTLSPDKVYKYHHGHAIKWTLKEIEPHEERILIFELKPLLRLVGSLEMKPTIIEFHNAKGKKNKNYSNKLEVA